MNIIRNIWSLLTGMDQDLAQLREAIKMNTVLLKSIEAGLVTLGENQVTLGKAQDAFWTKLQRMSLVLDEVQAELTPPPAVSLSIKLGGTTKGDNGMQKVADNGSVSAVLEADDALGNPGAKLDSVPAWSISDESIGAVVAAADGMSAEVKLTGKLGVAKLLVVAGALSAESEEFTVEAGAAIALKLSIAALAPAPAPAPEQPPVA